jgi:hypothetical protein
MLVSTADMWTFLKIWPGQKTMFVSNATSCIQESFDTGEVRVLD